MKIFILISMLIIASMLFGVTRTVSLDGSQQYSTIQTAIDESMTNDIVLVYPGRYEENVNFNGHNIILTSLYSQNHLQSYIENTIIDGNQSTCIRAFTGEHVEINGFTLVNNEEHLNQVIIISGGIGGGISIDNNSVAIISNCIIRDCFAKSGGGVSIDHASSVTLINNSIFNNRSYNYGGGIVIYSSIAVFSPDNLNSIYNNIGAIGMDIYVGDMADYPNPTNIILDKGSRNLTETDYFFVTTDNAAATVNIAQSYFPVIDNDIYVSPNGSDDSDGLSAVTPFKTIYHALQTINANPDNPHTVFLSAGNYSYSTGQIFPLSLKPCVNIRGAGAENTILDAELYKTFFCGNGVMNICMSDLKFCRCRASSLHPIDIEKSRDIQFRNITMHDNMGSMSSGISISRSSNIICENLDIGFAEGNEDLATIEVNYSDNVYVNNVISHGNYITDQDCDLIGLYFSESDVMVRNSVITDNQAADAYLFHYQNAYPEQSSYNLDMSNVLIYNNSVPQSSWVFAPIYLQNRYQRMQINNCTFAHNQGNDDLTNIFGYADIRNLISYNPGYPRDMFLTNYYLNSFNGEYVIADVNVSNSLFYYSSVNSTQPSIVTFTDDIFSGNPLFEGSVNDTLDITDPEYYRLSANSPCIDAGTPDTLGLNLPVMDLAGNYRVWDNRIDMGCYEYNSEPVGNEDPVYPIQTDKISMSIYPNPVYPNGRKGGYTFIELTLPEKAHTKPVIEIYNLKGQSVRTMTPGESYMSLARKSGIEKQHGFLPAQERQERKTGIGEANTDLPHNRNGFTTASSKAASAESVFGSPNIGTGLDPVRRQKSWNDRGEFYSTVWDCRDDRSQSLSAGIYLVKVKAGNQQTSSKITILK